MALALIMTQSCRETPTVPLDTRTIRSIRLGAIGDFGMNVGQTMQLVVTLRDSMSDVIIDRDRAISFTSSDTTVAVVNSSGVVTARSTGISNLTARIDSLSSGTTLHVAPPTPQFAQIEVGGSTTCALTAAGSAFCWPNRFSAGSSNGAPQLVAAPVAFQSIAVGNTHQCALDSSGLAYCWGDNSTFQLGTGDTISHAAPTPVLGGLRFTSLSAGWRSTCAIAVDGAAYCWGFNASGELGNGSTTSSAVPVPVSGGLHFSSLSAGDTFTCGLTSAGAECWGDNHLGQLGNGDTLSTTVPVRVTGGLSFTSISAGGAHACAVTASGKAYCWGANISGDLGIGPTSNVFVRATPLPVAGGLTWRAVSVGGMTCGTATTGLSYCWGGNLYSLLADGFWTMSSPVPALVWGGLRFRVLSARGDHACGLGFDAFVYCWGGYVS
jgi:alpha-tubulin suppressor-like RCC1 family protein